MAIYIALVCGLLLHISSNAVAQSKIVFGEANPPFIYVTIVKKGSSISTKDFFTTFVYEQSPVVFKAAILNSPAFRLWTNKYFMKPSGIPNNRTVLVENREKESRTNPSSFIPFKEFVSVYNITDQYMVEPVLSFLRLVSQTIFSF